MYHQKNKIFVILLTYLRRAIKLIRKDNMSMVRNLEKNIKIQICGC